MGQTGEKQNRINTRKLFNLTLAAVASQVGCLTVVIIIVALVAGLWLDSHFETKPTFIIILLIASVPITVIMMLWIVRKATSRLKKTTETNTDEHLEDVGRGTNT